MSGKNKNRKRLVTEFFRYHRNELTAKERNLFERELQKDPFAEEAVEGYTSITPQEALNDIGAMRKRLGMRTARRQRYIVYRIAASAAILIMISTVFIFIEKNKSGKNLADNSFRPQSLEIMNSQPVTGPEVKEGVSQRQIMTTEKKTDKSVMGKTRMEPGKNVRGIENFKIAEKRKVDSISENKGEEVQLYVADESLAIPPNAVAQDRALQASKKVEAKAEAEVEVEAEKSKAFTGYVPAQPVIGKSEFDKYIKDNLHRPDSVTAGQRVVVVVSFLVLPDGQIDSIRIVRSPGKLFSDEAIRVIKSGPSWKPAEEKGKIIKDEVKLRIVFR